MRLLTALSLVLCTAQASATEAPYCGTDGVWIQILGSGDLALDNDRAAPSYLVWIDDQARVLIDAGSAAALRYDEANAEFNDLDVIALTHLHAAHTADLPSLIEASADAGRTRPLPVLGPSGNETTVSTKTFIERLIGPEGAYSHLADFLTFRSRGGYKVTTRDVPAMGQRRWSQFGNADLELSAVPVHHGDVPALAWRVDIADQAIVFAGDFNNQKDIIAKFAEGADVLVVSHAIPESTRGALREAFAIPSQIGRIAALAKVRILILGHRSNRTRGVESQTIAAIEEHYGGSLLFADDLDCWGL